MSSKPYCLRLCGKIQNARFADVLTLVVFAIYINLEILLRNSTLRMTYGDTFNAEFLSGCECAICAMAIVSLLMRIHKFSLWQLGLAAFALASLALSAQRTNDYRMLLMCVIVISIAGINLERICKTYFVVAGITIVLLMFLAITGVIYNRDVIPNSRLVYAYGIIHPNMFGAILLSIVGSMAYVTWNRKTWKATLAFCFVAAAFAYIELSSHASSILLIALGLIIAMGHLFLPKKPNALSKGFFLATLFAVPLILMTVMLYCAAFFDGSDPVQEWFDNLIHIRPSLAHNYYVNNGGFTLLGRAYTGYSNHHTGLPFGNVDSGYCYVPLVYGLLAMCALILVYITAMKNIATTNRHFLIWALILLNALFLVMGSNTLYLYSNFTIAFLSEAFAPPEKRTSESRFINIDAEQRLSTSETGGLTGLFQGRFDSVTLVLVSVFLAAFVASAAFGEYYTNVNQQVAVGDIEIDKSGEVLLEISTDKDLHTKVKYANREIEGDLYMAGAEVDSILFQLKRMRISGERDVTGAVMFIRIPRTGVQGDYLGPWAVYYSWPVRKEHQSDWIILSAEEMAFVGNSSTSNPMTQTQQALLRSAKQWRWEKSAEVIRLVDCEL